MTTRVLVLLACAVLLGACDEPDLPKPWRITYARVLGVRAEVAGDEARATPEPGERVRVRVLIAADQPIDGLSYDLIACPAAPPRGELPSCAGEPFFADQQELGPSGSSRELAVEVDVPEDGSLEGAARVLIAGTICTDGAAESIEGGEGRCKHGSTPPVTFAAHVTLALDEAHINHNPVLAADAIRFDDELWAPHVLAMVPAEEDAGMTDDTADAGGSLAAAANGKDHVIEVSLEDSGRETTAGVREELQLSHFVTAGRLGRRFSVLEREQDGSMPFEIKWHMPRVDDPPNEVLVIFVLRDQRGGVDFALRRLALE